MSAKRVWGVDFVPLWAARNVAIEPASCQECPPGACRGLCAKTTEDEGEGEDEERPQVLTGGLDIASSHFGYTHMADEHRIAPRGRGIRAQASADLRIRL